MSLEGGTSGEELVAATDAFGNPWLEQVSRSKAHRQGVWHRSVSVFVLNRLGEVLVEKRSENKDLFPGFYDIVGGHLHPGELPSDAACQEISEELGLSIASSRLEALAPEDSVVERVFLAEQSIVNLERKSVYLLILNSQEEADVLTLAGKLRRLTAIELEARGVSGEVSQIEFWPWDQLSARSPSTSVHRIASGALTAINNVGVREGVTRSVHLLRSKCRSDFLSKYAFLAYGQIADDELDKKLFEDFLEWPNAPAAIDSVYSVFEKGVDTVAGAYEIGPFRRMISGDEHWESKLRDPENRYVRNLLTAIGFGQDEHLRQQLERMSSEIQHFVSETLNLPLIHGDRFRDRLGNLADIATARRATLIYLKNKAPQLVTDEVIARPTSSIKAACLKATRRLLERFFASRSRSDLPSLIKLVLLGLEASSTDFNNPAFQLYLRDRLASSSLIARFLEDGATHALSDDLGGTHFLTEFYGKFIASGKTVNIAYLAGNASQGLVGLAVIQQLLEINANATVSLIPKSGFPGNDLTFEDAENAMEELRDGVLAGLSTFHGQGRFKIIDDGPRCHGLDPRRLSANVVRELAEADVIFAEGQAYAEIRGWKKPTYIAFRINGRVAEAVHGVPRPGAGFVRLTPGVEHFSNFAPAANGSRAKETNERRSSGALQTTNAYVRAILGENLDLIGETLFHGDRDEACRQICLEAARLGTTFAGIVLGLSSELSQNLRDVSAPTFRVFACGGGGGFNGVTLRALRQLGFSTVAGVPSTDDGGNTGELQHWLRKERGFVFGVGDMAAIIQDALSHPSKRALLAYRFDCEPESLPLAVIERIREELDHPTDLDNPLGKASDFLSFTCDQLNFASIIESRFRAGRSNRLPIKGASIRNLNVIAAYEYCDLLGDRVSEQSRLRAFLTLRKSLRLPVDLLVLPVTYSECVLYIDYGHPISREMAADYGIPEEAIAEGRRRLYGQQYIDKLPQFGPRTAVGVVRSPQDDRRPVGNSEYLTRLANAQLFVMGAGSLIGSQLSQLAVPGVIDILLERRDMRRILVLNHVKMDETLNMTVKDQVQLIVAVATMSASPYCLDKVAGRRVLRISDIFTDIVVPRTIARDLEGEMAKRHYTPPDLTSKAPSFVNFDLQPTSRATGVLRNRYVSFLVDYPELRDQYGITNREIEVLSYLEQPSDLYKGRSEMGRYRGALFATEEDINYLVENGIQRRSIHEVDSIGRNWKFVKSEGARNVEEFPGLVSEALGGIFRIALERSGTSA